MDKANKALLMLDDFGALASSPYQSEALKREIDLVDTVEEAAQELIDNPEKYAAFLVEPFVYFKNWENIQELQNLMVYIKKSNLPVIVYTTEDETLINQKYDLHCKTHYDIFVSKMEENAVEKMKNTLNNLLPK